MLRRLLAVGPLVAVSLACASPTLPLPPPEMPSEAPGPDADHIKLTAQCGGAQANAVIVIVNQNPAVPNDEAVSGSRADGCGAWDATVFAHAGDDLTVTEEVDGTESQPATVVVR